MGELFEVNADVHSMDILSSKYSQRIDICQGGGNLLRWSSSIRVVIHVCTWVTYLVLLKLLDGRTKNKAK